MNMFAKRKEEDEQIPKSGNPQPRAAVAQPTQPPAMPAAAPAAPRSMSAPAGESTSIGRTVSIKGEIHSGEDLLIDGQVEGRLDLDGHRLVVGPDGKVQAAIGAREVDVHGTVSGNVEATERVILRKNSKLVGDLKMTSIVIEDGAYFKGSIDIQKAQGANAPAPGAAARAK